MRVILLVLLVLVGCGGGDPESVAEDQARSQVDCRIHRSACIYDNPAVVRPTVPVVGPGN